MSAASWRRISAAARHALRLLAFGLAAAAALEPALAGDRFEQGLLWRVEAPGAAPSHLFGTMHAGEPRVLGLAAALAEPLAAARTAVFEVVASEAAAQRFREAMLSAEPTLPQWLGKADYARLDAGLARAGIPAELRPRLKPWAALLILAKPRETPAPTLDELLQAEAAKLGRPVGALESIDEQIAVMDELPPATQLALLRHAIRREAAIRRALAPMVEAYLAGDLARMVRIDAQVMAGGAAIARENERLLERVLFERNQRFAERLEPRLKEGGVFAAFGALHLHGERGVLRLLEQRGFRVSRISKAGVLP